jgi:probable addiction module antidote protein
MAKELKKIKTSVWDITKHLATEQDIAEYMTAVMELNDPDLIKLAVYDIARARGMSDIAKKAGVSREGLYTSFSKSGNPSFKTVGKVLNSLGLRLSVLPL